MAKKPFHEIPDELRQSATRDAVAQITAPAVGRRPLQP
jgi:hypothetical protein